MTTLYFLVCLTGTDQCQIIELVEKFSSPAACEAARNEEVQALGAIIRDAGLEVVRSACAVTGRDA